MIPQEIIFELSNPLKIYINGTVHRLLCSPGFGGVQVWCWSFAWGFCVLVGAELLKDSFVGREILVAVSQCVSRCFDVTFVFMPTAAHIAFKIQ